MTNNQRFSSVSFCHILFMTFLVLKLTNLIDWSWWWVTAPIWIPMLIVIPITVWNAIKEYKNESGNKPWQN